MIYIPRDLVIRAMRRYAGAEDLGPEAEDDKCDIQDRLWRKRRRCRGGASFRGAT